MYAELHSWSNFTFSRRRIAPRRAGRPGGRAGLGGARADRPRRPLRQRRVLPAGPSCAALAAIVGSELTFDDGARIVLLVEDERGYANLCELISRAQLRGSKGDARLQFDDFDGPHRRLDRALRRSRRGASNAHSRTRGPARAVEEIRALARPLRRTLSSRTPTASYTEEDAHRNQRLVHLARELHVPYVATNGVVYADKDDAPLADVLRCVKHGTNLERARADHLLRPNAEFHLKSAAAMRRLFSRIPKRSRSVEIAAPLPFPARAPRRTVSALSGGRRQNAPNVSARTRLPRRRRSATARRSPIERRTPARIRTRHHRQDGSGRLLS